MEASARTSGGQRRPAEPAPHGLDRRRRDAGSPRRGDRRRWRRPGHDRRPVQRPRQRRELEAGHRALRTRPGSPTAGRRAQHHHGRRHGRRPSGDRRQRPPVGSVHRRVRRIHPPLRLPRAGRGRPHRARLGRGPDVRHLAGAFDARPEAERVTRCAREAGIRFTDPPRTDRPRLAGSPDAGALRLGARPGAAVHRDARTHQGGLGVGHASPATSAAGHRRRAGGSRPPEAGRGLRLLHLPRGRADGQGQGGARPRRSRHAAQAAASQGRGVHPAQRLGGRGHTHQEGAATTAKKLSGLGVSAGTATGTARIVMNTEAAFARDIEPGEILVAPFTDTPWTPLFIPAAAVVVETGGMLSHAATVAREFGIPCVVLVEDATRAIRDGDTITVDGATGTVTIVRRA
ncbi:MAG: hypothetical protein KGR47_06695 [Acidobacteria bacterium]|nr:hypothetical protein [Acidobacteriota bacterium]